MKARLTLVFALLLVCAGAGVALAQTPDPCGDETGAAYGLCTAYVAAECQTDTPSASDVACSRIADKFLQITGRDLPSKFTTCPCNVPGTLFNDYAAGNIPITSCSKGDLGPGTTGIMVSNNTTPFATAGIGEEVWLCGPPYTYGLSEAEGMLCVQLLEQAAANQGVACN